MLLFIFYVKVNLEIDSDINCLCEKVVDYYDTRTIDEYVQTIWSLYKCTQIGLMFSFYKKIIRKVYLYDKNIIDDILMKI